LEEHLAVKIFEKFWGRKPGLGDARVGQRGKEKLKVDRVNEITSIHIRVVLLQCSTTSLKPFLYRNRRREIMSTKPCCNDMKAYRIDFWPRILPANPVTDWIQVCEDHGSSIQVEQSQADGLIEITVT